MAGAGITLDIARERVDEYLTAESAVLAGQAVRFADGREVTRANLQEIREGIAFWQGQVRAFGGVKMPAIGRVRRGAYRSR